MPTPRCVSLLFCLLLASPAFAQDYRATILGQVTDPTGSAIPNASVKAIREGTNDSKETVSNAGGLYTIVGLEPGRYTVAAAATGFNSVRRESIVVQTAEKLNLPIRMEVGAVTQEITVVGEQELIQTTTASRGLVFDPIMVQEIPLNGRQAYMLMRLSPGVMFSQRTFGATGFSGTRAWDVNGSFVMNGGRTGSNQFLLNGAPISTNGTFNLAPNVEAIQEMKVMVNTYDSQYGRSGGGHVSTTLKSGTNQFHGSLFDFWRNRILDANTRQNNAGGSKRGFRNQHQFGGVIGGPIRKEKDFFFFSFEGWRERTPFPSVTSAPPQAIRNGDFNFIPAGQSGPILVYDHLTSTPCGGTVVCQTGGVYQRQPFPGNTIPQNRISAVGRNILNLYPVPNFNPTSLTQNYLRPDNLGIYGYEQPMARWDRVLSSNDRLNLVFTFQDGSEFRNSNGFAPPAQNGNMTGTVRRDINGIVGFDKTLSAVRILHLQASVNRFVENFPNVSDPTFTWDKLGIKRIPEVPTFPSKLAPRVELDGFSTILGSQFRNQSSRQQVNFQANLSETRGRHTLKYGFEAAQLIRHNAASGEASGLWTFGAANWSRRHQGVRLAGPLDGSSVADLLLGLMNSGSVPFNDTFLRREPYFAGFIQDDWKISRRLTLNLGLRYDVQVGMYEINNRLVSGFDFQTKNPISDQVLARWRQLAASTANYPAPPSEIRGGLTFAGVGGQPRRVFDTDMTNIQPRIGFAFNALDKTVVRGGFGIYHRASLPGAPTTGFSQSTPYIPSINGNQSHRAGTSGLFSLEDPFPDGLIPPLGGSQGLLTSVGTGATFDARDRRIPRTLQWSFTVERELPWSMVLEASYVGSRTIHELRSLQLSDASQAEYAIAGPNPAYFQAQLPNPWFGILPTNVPLGASATISRQNLLRRIPQFNSVTQNSVSFGTVWYNGLQVRFEKRMLGDRSRAGALTWVTAYTFSKQMEDSLRQNFTFEWMPLIDQVTAEDRSHNLTYALIWDLPFGKGRSYFNTMTGPAQVLLGGWTFNANLIYQSGVPLGAWNRWEYTCGDPTAGTRSETHWFDQTRSCYRQLTNFELTQLPSRFHQIRSHAAPQLDLMLSKRFHLTERYQLEFRGEAFNATNTPLRGDPPSGNPSSADFGVLPVAQLNFARNVQLGMRLRF